MKIKCTLGLKENKEEGHVFLDNMLCLCFRDSGDAK